MMKQALSVTALNEYIKYLLEEDVLLEALLLSGEVSNFTRHSSGHLYFSLKDEHSSISCVMFRDAARELSFRPENGMEVSVFGRVGVYEKQGRYQMYVNIMTDTKRGGKTHLSFEALKTKLGEKGYFDQAIKKELPETVRTVALVTSPTGAAVRDMLKIAGSLDPAVKIVIVPCLVQGDEAAASIARGIALVDKWARADVMIVGRGGGSVEDLWAFNEEVVAEAIFRAATPVISAVGHEIDFTIADFVADYRASTPSSAITAVIKPKKLQTQRLKWLRNRLDELQEDVVYDYEARLRNLANSRAFTKPQSLCENYESVLKSSRVLLNMGMKLHAERVETSSQSLIARLEEASPIKIMKKGYSVAVRDGKVIKSIKDVSPQLKINVMLSDGSFDATVESIAWEGNKDA